jgi:hypothetical protein
MSLSFSEFDNRGALERIKDNVYNVYNNYVDGALKGSQEVDRQNANINSTIAKDENGQIKTDENGAVQFVNGQQSFDNALAQRNQATATYNNETTKPVIMTVAPFVSPAFGLTMLGADLAPTAQKTYQETEGTPLEKFGNAFRSVTYAPAQDMYNDPNLSQKFHDNPVTTITEGALAAGQALLPIAGARYGLKKAGEVKNDLVSRVDAKLNEITDNPPLENIGIQGLDALDQLDAPNQGFRPATKQELQQTVMEQLDQIKGQKFDEANTQSYLNDMARQERESNALQTQKNEIAGSVLFSPLDRIEVGADLPIKTSLGGQGAILGERPAPNQIYLGEKPNPQPIIQEKQPRYAQPQERPFLPSAEQLIDERNTNNIYRDSGIGKQQFSVLDKKELSKQIVQYVKDKDFAGASRIAEQIGNSKLADTLRSVAEKQPKLTENPYIEQVNQRQPNRITNTTERQQMIKPIEKPHQELVRMVEEKIKAKEQPMAKPIIDMFDKKVEKLMNDLVYNADKSGFKDVTIKDTQKRYNDVFKSHGQEKALSALNNTLKSFKDKVKVIENKSLESAKKDIFKKVGSIPTALRDIKKSILNGEYDSLDLQSVEDVKKAFSVKLNSGFDPTGGRYDHINLAEQATKTALKVRDRIVNGIEDNRIIDNNSKGLKDLPPIKKLLQRAYQQTIDSLDPISRYDKEVYKSARLANGSAVGKAESMIKNQNNPMSFENITKPIHDKIDDFAEYMVAVRAKELHATGTMTGVSNAKIAKIIADAPPEFEPVRKAMTKYSDNLVEMLVDSGMISEEHAINMFNKYESYAPMMKAFDGEEISAMFKGKGDLGKPIKNIEGSDSKVVNPIESILKNTYTFNMIAETNKVRQQVARLAESFPDDIKILKVGESAEKGTGTFDFFVNGEKRTMQLEPRLFEAIASMDSQQAGIVVTVLSKPASWLRAGATISPEFMAKNLIRDTIGAGIVGKDFVPFVDSIKGLKSAWTKDVDYWKYKEEGGALGHLTGLDRNHMQEMLDNYRTKNKAQKLSAVFNPKTWLEVLRRGQELSEDATRIGYYKKRMAKGDSSHEAAFEARDLLDFGRSGNWTREANKVSAFLNASLQGTDKLIRSFKERPLETSVNTMKYLVFPSMAVWYMQHVSDQKEEIQNLPRYVKDMFWVVPVGDKLIRIPKPFEAGVLFGTGTERTMEAMFGDSKKPYKGYGESLMDVTIPNLIPTALIPLGEWWANKSFFTGQAIVPMKEQDLPNDMQYGPYTTNTAKFAGKLTGQSPRKIDNAIRGLTGGAGTAVVSAVDTFTGGGTNRPSQTISDMPVVKAFIADPRKGQQSTQDFYDELEKYTKTKRAESVRNVKMTPTEKKNYESLNNANTALKALNKEERKIVESTSISADTKRQKLDKIIDAQTKLVQASLKRLKN